ncbi:MAG: hypothetical protein LLG04_18310 [Parachlamydia sp.]|nr:hypothetical protein [Parachlamydia sp.]
MADNISFKTAVQVCDALGKFADARSGTTPNKDFIMMVRKVDGRETLQLTQISQLNWMHRLIRCFGLSCLERAFGRDTTLKGVTDYLHRNCPYLPRRFSDLKVVWMPDILKGHYHKEAIPELLGLKKERLKKMREDKFRGIEIFKKCLSHHNAKSPRKIYLSCLPGDQIDLRGYWRGGRGIIQRGPNPMGLLPGEVDQGQIVRKYEAPVIDPKEFPYLEPFFCKKNEPEDLNALGFCYEYGLGVKKNHQKALNCYKVAVEKDPGYASLYNLGRLYLQDRQWQEANRTLTEAENFLNNLKLEGDRLLGLWAQRRANPPPGINPDQWDESNERAVTADLKICNKALSKVIRAQMELHRQTGDQIQLEQARQRLNTVT